MQQWLNEPKNQPIVFGIAGVVLVGAIVYILFFSGVLGNGGAQSYVPPPSVGTAAAGNPFGSTQPSQPAATPSGPPTTVAAVTTEPAPVAPGTPTGKANSEIRPPVRGAKNSAAARHSMKVATAHPVVVPERARPAQPTGPVQTASAAGASDTPVLLTGVPNARRDPFAPYIDLTQFLKAARAIKPRVDTIVPPLTITNFSPTAVASANVGYGGGSSFSPPQFTGRVSGVMIGPGTGAYAIVDNNGSSQVLQPGDLLPQNGGKLISIQSDSISVEINGQIVRVPISTGDTTATGVMPAATGQGGGYGPPAGAFPPGYVPGSGPPPGAFPPGFGPGAGPPPGFK